MRIAALLLLLAAGCPRSSAPAAKLPTPLDPDPTPAPPAAEVVDDAYFLDAGGIRERVVIKKLADGWRYESERSMTEGPVVARGQLWIETDADGRFRAGHYLAEISDGANLESQGIALRREGDEVVAETEDGVTSRAAAGDLLLTGELVGQMPGLCRIAGPRTITAIGQPPVSLGPPEPLEGGVTRARLALGDRQGSAELYCDGDRLLAIDGPGDTFHAREDDPRFEALRRPLPTKPAPPAEVVEVETTVEVKATGEVPAATLTCSLVTPAGGKGKAPGVVLLTGDGFQDRDNDAIFEPAKRALHRHLAYRLGPLGIASLRCDDRGIGGSSGAQIVTVETLAADAAAMVAALRADKRVDRKRIALVAVQENAQIAPKVWQTTKLGAMVLIEPRVRGLDEILREGIEAQLRAAGEDALIAGTLERFDAAIAAVRRGEPLPVDAPELLAEALDGPAGDYLRSFIAYDARAAAAAIARTDLLLVDATFDDGRPTANAGDADELAAILAKAKGKKKNAVTVLPRPDLDSELIPREAGDEGVPAAPWTPHAGALVDAVVEFLSRSL